MSKTFQKRFVFVISAITILSLSSCLKDLQPPSLLTDPAKTTHILKTLLSESHEYEQNELLVKFKPGFSEKEKENVIARINGKVSEKIDTKSMERVGDHEGFLLIHTPFNVLEARDKIKGSEIEYAEPNYIYTYSATANDFYFINHALWGMDATNIFGSQASTAWANGHTGSAAVYVGVIDEGIQFDHPDLAGQIWTNPYDIVDGIDNDGNGYVDDIHGWDFVGNDNVIYSGGKQGTEDAHGTHVAGTIGALNNNIGVVGMNWNITIISAKFLGTKGGTTADAVKALDYITDLKVRHHMNIVATNNSWSGGGYSQALYNAISRANAQGILFIAAAGNGDAQGVGLDNDSVPNYPSNYNLPNVIAVAAIAEDGSLASFSNWGATTVHLGAPGVNIWSTIAYNLYASYSGTSMAAPHVTGAVALYKSTHPSATAADIKSAILSSTTPTPSLIGKTISGGRLNVSGF